MIAEPAVIFVDDDGDPGRKLDAQKRRKFGTVHPFGCIAMSPSYLSTYGPIVLLLKLRLALLSSARVLICSHLFSHSREIYQRTAAANTQTS